MLIIVFGEMGMGKNYVGELIAEKLNYVFFDGDKAIRAGEDKLDSPAGVHRFVQNGLIPAIKAQLQRCPNLVVSQALYFQEDRDKITKIFEHVKFIHITCSAGIQEKRLLQREEKSSEKWLKYNKFSKPYFETPPVNEFYSTIANDTHKEDVMRQISILCETFKLPARVALSRSKTYKSNLFSIVEPFEKNEGGDCKNAVQPAISMSKSS